VMLGLEAKRRRYEPLIVDRLSVPATERTATELCNGHDLRPAERPRAVVA
jgi:hypothetical protein